MLHGKKCYVTFENPYLRAYIAKTSPKEATLPTLVTPKFPDGSGGEPRLRGRKGHEGHIFSKYDNYSVFQYQAEIRKYQPDIFQDQAEISSFCLPEKVTNYFLNVTIIYKKATSV